MFEGKLVFDIMTRQNGNGQKAKIKLTKMVDEFLVITQKRMSAPKEKNLDQYLNREEVQTAFLKWFVCCILQIFEELKLVNGIDGVILKSKIHRKLNESRIIFKSPECVSDIWRHINEVRF